MDNVRVLVVDDSATMRHFVTAALQREGGIDVVGQASDPFEARQLIKSLNPNVITLDIEMPGMNGLEFLEKIMRLRPMPVVMVSTLTKQGACATLQALELGAVDYIAKPSPEDPSTFDCLGQKVKQAARVNLRGRQPHTVSLNSVNVLVDEGASHKTSVSSDLIAFGASTGGVEALTFILRQFPVDCPPTIITQHMPALFTSRFAARLDTVCQPKVLEVTAETILEKGHIYLASGDNAHMEVSQGVNLSAQMVSGPSVNGHRPAVDVMFRSVARAVGKKAIGVILTGMGRDGADGLLKMKSVGARTIGQNEQSCVVYGMPKVAFGCGAVETLLPLEKIAQEIFDIK